MTELSKEMLFKFFGESELFKGIDTNAAVEEFLKKVSDPPAPSLAWVVIEQSSKSEIVGAFAEYEDAEKMHKLLPNSWIDDLYVDRFRDDVRADLKLFDVELNSYGELMSVSSTVQFITGNEDDSDVQDEKALSDGSYIYKLSKCSYFASDENEAVSFAKMAYQSNKDFQDHADDGVADAMGDFDRQPAFGLVRMEEDGTIIVRNDLQ